ncbi:hypothetical protein LGL73_14505, partial [Staphylococcus aureus]|uniref:hypothetical protein n=1 Tax=Staphylococcus aureus TaxID=1280 RepID=UPI001CF3F1DC
RFKAKLQDALDSYQKSTWYLAHSKELIAKPWGQKYSIWDDTLKMHLADYKIEAKQDGTLKLLLVVDFDKEYKKSLACSM